ncbi:oxygenase MpaB family protein [Streptomyces sp. SBT349]|uniref:oxygenase MpaB family protein n=1 Tax=Streptomyces sp. SBT349 TaxID=1580539 RepID=UPI00069EB7D6|nr:oxygenase MpaB family protein [Streptomyces sp. SBT349]
MDEERAHAVYRRLAVEVFPDELRMGLNLGFYRTFAVPGIAEVLVGTGKMTGRPVERAKATGVLMYTLIEHGPRAPEGRRAVEALNGLHAHLPVGQEEFVYVLAAFCVSPLRHIDAFGRRATTPCEREAAHRFYAGLADRMGIRGVPGSFAALAAWMDAFERRSFAVTPEGRALMDATRGVLASRLPRLLAPVARPAVNALFDERLLAAFGAAPAPRAVRRLVRFALAVRTRGRASSGGVPPLPPSRT